MDAASTSVALPAVVTQARAQSVANDLVPRLARCVAQGGEAVLDAGALVRFDSAALAVILACRRAVVAQGGVFQVKGLPVQAQTLAQVYGLSDLIQPNRLAVPA